MIQIAFNPDDLEWDAYYMDKYIASAQSLEELLEKLKPEAKYIDNEYKTAFQ